MSKTIDDKVVEMRFDNSHFEKNVQTSLTTLQKLKQNLDLKGASKGLSEVNAAAKKCDLSPLGNGIQTVQAKFSALTVVGTTALMNLTNSAITAGKNIVSALTIDPVTTGFSEYELKMGSVQTIMASTGASLDTVNKYLNELNEYSDKTIYSFSDMTQNIGKFTNAGVKLEDAVLAIKGISNEAAVSGANANEASRAMYNFAQALSAGYVKLIDWKSIELANMATTEFKQQLIDTAVEVGTLKKVTGGYQTEAKTTITATKNFNDSLQDQWMTTDVLIKTLGKYADETTDIGNKASKAATEVKTFSQLFDTLKESAQSGWATSWEIIVGDYTEAKNFLTWVNGIVGDIIGKSAEKRNNYLEEAFGESKGWEQLSAKIKKTGVSLNDFKTKAKEVAKSHGVDVDALIKKHGSFAASLKEGWLTSDLFSETMNKLSENGKKTVKVVTDGSKKLKELEEVAKKVINGSFGNGQERVEALTKAGYKYSQVQTIVNQLLSGQKVKLDNLSETQLKQIGYTEEEIKAIQELGAQAEKSGSSIDEMIESMSKPSGRDLLIESFKNLYEYIKKIVDIFKGEWEKVFPDSDDGNVLYDLIEKFHAFSESLTMTEEKITNMTAAFKGFVDALWLLKNLAGGPLLILRQILIAVSYVLGFGDIWQLLGSIGTWISQFKGWIRTGNEFSQTLINIGTAFNDFVTNTVNKVVEWFNKFKELPIVTKSLEEFKTALSNTVGKIGNWITGFSKPFERLFTSLASLNDLTFDDVYKIVEQFIRDIISQFGKFGEVFTEIETVISDIFTRIMTRQGNSDNIFAVLATAVKDLYEWIKGFGTVFADFYNKVKSLDSITFDDIKNLATGLGSNLLEQFGKIGDVFTSFLDSAGNFGDMLRDKFGAVGDAIADFIDKIVTFGKDAKAALDQFFGEDFGFGQVATVAMGAGMIFIFSSLLKFLDKVIDAAKVWIDMGKNITESFKALCTGISTGVKDLGKAAVIEAKSVALKNFAIAIGILAASLWIIAQIPTDDLIKAGIALLGLAIILGGLAFALGKMEKLSLSFGKGASALAALAIALIIIIAALKMMENLDGDKVWENLGILALILGGMTVALIAIGRFAPKMENSAGTILALSVSLAILVLALERLAGVKINDIGETAGLLLLGIFALAAVAEVCGKIKPKKALGALAAIGSFWLLVTTLEKFGELDAGKILQNIILMLPIFAVFAGLMAATQLAGKHAVKGAAAVILITIAMGLMVGVIKMMGIISANDLAKASGAIIAMTVVFGLVIALSKFAGKHAHKAGLLIMEMAVAMFLLTLPIAILSLLDPAGLERAVEAVQGLMAVMAIVVAATGYMKEAKDAKGTIIAMGIVIGVLAVTIGVLSLIKPDRLQSATEAISIVMAMFALMIASTQFIGEKVGKTIAVIVLMTLAVGAMAGIIYMLSGLNPQGVLNTSLGLSALLLSLSTSMAILSTVKGNVMKAMPAMGVLTVIVAALAAILGALTYLDAAPSLESAAAISVLLLTMTGVCAVLGLLGPMGVTAIANTGILLGVVTAIGAFMVGVGALVKKFPEIEEFATKGIELLNTIAGGIGSFISSFMEGFTSNLPDIGVDLALFATGLMPFIAGMKQIDDSVITGVNTLVNAITSLAGANIVDSIGEFFTGETSLESFGNQLVPFGEKLAEFASAVAGVDGTKLSTIVDTVSTIVDAASKVPDDGLFGGGTTIEEFGTQLTGFGSSLVTFSNTIGGIENLDHFKNVAAASNEIVKMAGNLPEEGLFTQDLGEFSTHIGQFGTGLVTFSQSIAQVKNLDRFEKVAASTGHIVKMSEDIPEGGLFVNDLGTFSTHIQQFGTGLAAFSTAITPIDNLYRYEKVAESTGHIIKMSEDIPEGGLFVDDLGDFSDHIAQFGTGLASFSTAIAPIKNFKKFATVAEASNNIVKLCKNLPETGWFDGKMSLKDLGNAAADFGSGMATFSTNIAEVDAVAIGNAIGSANRIIKLINGAASIENTAVDGFQAALEDLGNTGINGFVTAFKDTDGRVAAASKELAQSAVSAFSAKIKNSGGNFAASANLMVSKFSTAIANQKSRVSKGFTSLITSAVNVIKTKYAEFKTAGQTIVTKMVAGLKNKTESFKDAAKTVVNSGKTGVMGKYDSFVSAGKYLGEGLVEGINAKQTAVYNAAFELGQKAVEGEKAGQKSNSPSKATIQAGKWLGEGLVIGINGMASAAYNAAKSMGADATDGLARALDPVKNLSDLNIDSQPTIRPVLDLTDVQNGASRIGSILNGQGVSLSSSISSAVDRASGIGSKYGDNEVVNAINKLRTDISGMSKTENNLNFNGTIFNDDDRINTLMVNLLTELARKGAMGTSGY